MRCLFSTRSVAPATDADARTVYGQSDIFRTKPPKTRRSRQEQVVQTAETGHLEPRSGPTVAASGRSKP